MANYVMAGYAPMDYVYHRAAKKDWRNSHGEYDLQDR